MENIAFNSNRQLAKLNKRNQSFYTEMCNKMKLCCGIDPNIVDVINKKDMKSGNAQENQIVDFEKTDTNLLRH